MMESTLVYSILWIEQVLCGLSATSIAVLAVAGLGALMLTGRLPARRGATVVIGCFVLFSARIVAEALVAIGSPPASPELATQQVEVQPYVPPIVQPVPYDPYAGASVPNFSGDPTRGIFSQ